MAAWHRRHPFAARAGATFVLLLVLAVAVQARESAQLNGWSADCAAQGGRIERQARFVNHNPIVTETSDPIYRCLAADGTVLSERS